MSDPTSPPSPDEADARRGVLPGDGADPVADDGHTDVEHGGATVRLVWHVRGDSAEATLHVAGTEIGTDDELLTDHDPAGLAGAVGAALGQLAARLADRGVTVIFAVDHPVESLRPLPELAADRAGLSQRRDLFQLRRPLPITDDDQVRSGARPTEVRRFTPDDGERWVRVNNRAFASHPDQGSETLETLNDRLAGSAADQAGFLLADDAERPGELAGFCWTVVHPATADDPELGEIYVVGVDPDRQGEGWGPALVLAGLDHMAGRGVAHAMLYVDESNTAARKLYDRLEFAPHHRRRVYQR